MKRTPVECPSCDARLAITHLACQACGTEVTGTYAPPPLLQLAEDDQAFIESFVLHSGSLKAMAAQLGVSYPTVRNRLNEIISRLEASR